MHFEIHKLRLVTISVDYLEELYKTDSEVFFSSKNNYKEKPHMGILVNNDGFDYVIPLTSAKPKHAGWRNITNSSYIIYENVPKDICTSKDIIAETKNSKDVKRILSVLEIKKMIPVKEGLYKLIDLNINKEDNLGQVQRKKLLIKEFRFCLKIKDQVLQKANKIYRLQVTTGKVHPFYCNYKKLEQICKDYRVK